MKDSAFFSLLQLLSCAPFLWYLNSSLQFSCLQCLTSPSTKPRVPVALGDLSVSGSLLPEMMMIIINLKITTLGPFSAQELGGCPIHPCLHPALPSPILPKKNHESRWHQGKVSHTKRRRKCHAHSVGDTRQGILSFSSQPVAGQSTQVN